MNDKHKKMIGQELKAARIAVGMTQQQVADILGYKEKSYIAQIERGEFKDSRTPKRYCEAIGAKFSERYYFTIKIK